MAEHPRINVTFDPETYSQIRLLAHKEGKSMSELLRQWSYERLNGEITQNNMDFICRIIREQLRDVLQPHVDRLAALNVKGSIQAAAGAYLAAETIARFVPDHLQEDFQDVYLQARKKAIRYMRNKSDETDVVE